MKKNRLFRIILMISIVIVIVILAIIMVALINKYSYIKTTIVDIEDVREVFYNNEERVRTEGADKFCTYYFGETIDYSDSTQETILSGIIGGMLTLEQESLVHSKKTIYRFHQYNSLHYTDISIQIEKNVWGGMITVYTYGDSRISYIVKYEKIIPPWEMIKFEKEFDVSYLDTIKNIDYINGSDGGYDCIESVKDGDYHYVMRFDINDIEDYCDKFYEISKKITGIPEYYTIKDE